MSCGHLCPVPSLDSVTVACSPSRLRAEKVELVVSHVELSGDEELSQISQFSSDPKDSNTPGSPVYHQSLEFRQTHVH